METKKGVKKNDSFHQTSSNFGGISMATVVCGSFWGLKKLKMAAVAMVTKVKNVNSLQTIRINRTAIAKQ
jgi:hypothetical protein